MRALMLVAALFVLPACGSSNPAAPTPVTLSLPGTWAGNYTSAQLGTGTLRLVLTYSGSSVGGTWSTTGSAGNASGTVSGMAPSLTSGATFTLMLSPSDPRTCPFQMTMTVQAHLKQLLGNWVTVNCTVTANGSVILTQ